MTCPSWVALPGTAHSFIELHKPLCPDKAVIHEGEGNPSKEVYGNIWLIHFASQQKVTQHYKELYSNKINNAKREDQLTCSIGAFSWLDEGYHIGEGNLPYSGCAPKC